MGKQFTLTADDSHQLGAYRADPAGPVQGRRGGHSGNFRRQQTHPRGLRPARGRRLHRRRAGAVRSHAERFRVRLHARRDRECAQVRRQPELGCDAEGHAGRDQRAEEGRPGRDRRLLHGRQHRLPGGDAALRHLMRHRLLWRPDRRSSPTRSRRCRCRCISARRTRASR